MNFAKNIAKRYKKTEAVKAEREKRIKERMEAKANAIATNATSQKNAPKKDEVNEEKKPIDLDRKISIVSKKTNENGVEMEVENVIPICFLPSCGENWKEAAKASDITDEEIQAIEKWYAENKDKVIEEENSKEE